MRNSTIILNVENAALNLKEASWKATWRSTGSNVRNAQRCLIQNPKLRNTRRRCICLNVTNLKNSLKNTDGQLVEHIKNKLESHIKKEHYFECKECDDAFKSNIDEKYGPCVVYKDKLFRCEECQWKFLQNRHITSVIKPTLILKEPKD